MNVKQAGVVDVVLSTHAQGCRQPELAGGLLFPHCPVPAANGKVLEFDKAAFKLYNTVRAPGGNVAQIDFGYEGKAYELLSHALDAKLPRETQQEAATVPKIDLGMRAVNVAMRAILLGLEAEQATMALDLNNYDAQHKITIGGGAKWTSDDVDPTTDIDVGREAIRASTGSYPNVCVLGASVWKRVKRHPKIKEQFKYTTAASVTTKMLAEMWEFETVGVGGAVKAADDANAAFSDLWGNAVVMAYVARPKEKENLALGNEQPSFGYTYVLGGHPFVEAPRWEGGVRSWLYGVTMQRRPVLSGISAGYIINAPLA